MKVNYENFEEVLIINNFSAQDNRGCFKKLYNKKLFQDKNLVTSYFETYYSISNKDVIRGMHFQTPPYDQEKLVHVIQGSIIDITLDLRKNSSTYGKFMEIAVEAEDNCSIYIPKGFAHGFKSLTDNTIVVYKVTSNYNRECDCGIRWDSFGYDWNVQNPIISDRDKLFESFDNFETMFE